jgi:TIR domain
VASELLKQIPTAFISYSWESEAHKEWVKRLGTRLRSDGIDLTLDEWRLAPGDQLPHFMEIAIRQSDFVLIVCTPAYKDKSDRRTTGVGYEGHIITAELMTDKNDRKFVPILRQGEWRDAAPSWLLGKLYVDLRGEPYVESNYQQLLNALRGILPEAPPLGTAPLAAPDQTADIRTLEHQKVYADFVNTTLRVHQAGKNRQIVMKQKSPHVARLMLPQFERDVQEQGRRAAELQREIDLFASEPVAKAAGEIAGWVLAFQMTSMVPELEPQLDEAYQHLITESLPKFRAAVREELKAGGSAA